MGTYLQDILDQPRDLRIALESYFTAGNLRQLRDLAARGFRKVVFAGMGSSNFCNCSASIGLNNRGFLTTALSAGELLHYEAGLLQKDALLVLVSQSGESAEVVRLIGRLPADTTVAAVTNDPGSTLGRRGDYTFALNVPEEESVTTRTYLASILLVSLLSEAVAGGDAAAFRRRAEGAIDSLERFLAGAEEFTRTASEFTGLPPYICVVGRGHSLGTARSGALFLREVVKYPALDFDGGEFRHGPFEMVDENFFGIVLAPTGCTRELNVRLAQDIAERGGRALLITCGGVSGISGRVLTVDLGDGFDEALAPIAAIAPIQLLADSLAKAKGIVAGKFRWGSKITAEE